MSSGYFNSPSALLAVAFPPQYGLKGATVTLQDLTLAAYRIPRLMSPREAARLIIARNMERHVIGNGNRARRRMRMLKLKASAPGHLHFNDRPLGLVRE